MSSARCSRVRELIKTYLGLVRSSALVALAYRGRVVIWFLTGFFPLLLMAVWLTVVAGNGPPRGWTVGNFVAYYVAAAVLWHLSGQHVVWDWDEDMRSGDMSVRLLRPVHPFHQYAANDLGYRAVSLAMLLPVLTLAAFLVPGVDYGLTLPRATAVAAAVLLAYVLSLLMASTFALVGFWSTQSTNLWMLWWGVGSFASGWIAPLELMPEWLRTAALVLPFRATMGFPIELLMGRLNGSQVAWGFATGLAWIGVFTGTYRAGWRNGVGRYQAVAG